VAPSFFMLQICTTLPYEILLYFVRIGIFINPSCEVLSYDPCSPDSSLPAILGVPATCLQNYVVVQDKHLAQEGT